MESIRPLMIKFIYIAAITIIFLTYLQVPSVALGTTLILALLITLALYFAGDRFLLPRYGTAASAIANFIIAAVILSLANPFVLEPITTGAILSAAAIMGVAEWFYYRYAHSEVASAAEGGNVASIPEFPGGPGMGHEGENPGWGGDQSREHREQPQDPGNQG